MVSGKVFNIGEMGEGISMESGLLKACYDLKLVRLWALNLSAVQQRPCSGCLNHFQPSQTFPNLKLHPFWASCQFVIRACLPRSNGQSCRTWKRAGSIEIKPRSTSMSNLSVGHEGLCWNSLWWSLVVLAPAQYKRLRWCRPHCLFTHQSAKPGVTTRDCCAAKQPIETQKISPHQDLVPTCANMLPSLQQRIWNPPPRSISTAMSTLGTMAETNSVSPGAGNWGPPNE